MGGVALEGVLGRGGVGGGGVGGGGVVIRGGVIASGDDGEGVKRGDIVIAVGDAADCGDKEENAGLGPFLVVVIVAFVAGGVGDNFARLSSGDAVVIIAIAVKFPLLCATLESSVPLISSVSIDIPALVGVRAAVVVVIVIAVVIIVVVADAVVIAVVIIMVVTDVFLIAITAVAVVEGATVVIFAIFMESPTSVMAAS